MNTRCSCSALVYALATSSCADAGSDDSVADTSTSVADTGTDATTLTTSMSDTTPTVTTDDPTLTTSMSMSMTESESETEVTWETDPTTGPTGCVSSLECTDPGSPVCVNEVCSPCGDAKDGDATCESKDPLTPACRDDGECVQCTPANAIECADVTPICDGESSSCVGCDYHEQCAGTACDMATGACFDDICLVDVFDTGDIADEIADGCVIRVHGGTYPETLTVSGETVALLSADDGDVYLQGVGGNDSAPALTVTGGANVYVQGFRISGNDGGGVGVAADGGSVWLDRTQIVGNTGGGIVLTDASQATVRNCFVRGADGQAALSSTGSSAQILYSTLVGVLDTSPAIACDAGVTVRNSAVLSRATGADPDIDCPATITFSAVELDYPGEGNVVVDPLTSGNQDVWFEDYASGDFHLVAPPDGMLSAAQWESGHPLVDIDGHLRPTENGASDVAGADSP